MKALREAAKLLAPCKSLVVFTGAGVSAESGLATFRGAGGLWEGHRVEEVATFEAFARDPTLVWRFYAQRREKAQAAEPNPAHLAIAGLQNLFPARVVVTQNVDGLHQRAGSRDVVELHGSLWTLVCTCCAARRQDHQVPLPLLPPLCPRCGGLERPGVVWFGEELPPEAWSRAQSVCSQADGLLVVGTSGQVWPAAGLVELASHCGARVVEVNPAPSALSSLAEVHLPLVAGEALPSLLASMEELRHAGI